MELITFSQNIHAIVERYQDLIGNDASGLTKDLAIDKPEELQASMHKIENEDRCLHIGMVGRVKSGKSSLLNALIFDGNDILPKAATPMTAALTVLTYGEQLGAEVEYYSKDDIAGMKKDHLNYTNEVEKRIAAFMQSNKQQGKSAGGEKDQERVRRLATKDLLNTPLAAVARQYDEICQHQGKRPQGERQEIEAGDIDALRAKLADYVGAGGSYTPFTKSITIRMPLEKLRDMEIVDTPGINDPVISREERTRALLSHCDVIFVVSPSGQFMSQEDLELMDRISTREGISELFLVNSKVDDQLQSPEEVMANNGLLPRVLESVNAKLTNHAVAILEKTRNDHHEVGNCYNKIIAAPKKRVMHTSAICFAMAMQLDHKESWDEGRQHLWKLLTKTYPDYFSDQNSEISKNSLELLAGVKQVSTSLEAVRTEKDKIMREKRDKLSRDKEASLIEYRTKLIAASKERQDKIKTSRIENLEENLTEMKKAKQKAGSQVDFEYEGLVEELTTSVKGVKERLKRHFQETKKDVGSEEKIKTESYEVSTSKWYKPWTYGSSETKTKDYTSVRTGAVISVLEEMTNALEEEVDKAFIDIFQGWRKGLFGKLVNSLRGSINDEALDDIMIRSAIKRVCANLTAPELEFGIQQQEEKTPTDKDNFSTSHLWPMRSEKGPVLRAHGPIRDSEAEEFIEEAKKAITNLKQRLNRQIDNHAKQLHTQLTGMPPSKDIFANYEADIEGLKEQIGHAELTTERFKKLIKELEAA